MLFAKKKRSHAFDRVYSHFDSEQKTIFEHMSDSGKDLVEYMVICTEFGGPYFVNDAVEAVMKIGGDNIYQRLTAQEKGLVSAAVEIVMSEEGGEVDVAKVIALHINTPRFEGVTRCIDCGYYHVETLTCNRPFEDVVSRIPNDHCSRAVRKKEE